MKPAVILSAAAAILLAAGASYAQKDAEGHGQAIVTVLPSHPTERAMQVSQKDITAIKVAGKPAQVTGWMPLGDQQLELVFLIDSEAQSSFGNQLELINQFVHELPKNTQMSIAWMQNGRAVLASPLSSDPAQVTKGIHLPSGDAGVNASPYFSLSDLARNWPSQNGHARRAVVMICDGIDDYNPRYDPNDPYMLVAAHDSIRAGLLVYSIFWPDSGRFSSFGWAQNAGQNLLTQLTAATGGTNFWQGFGDPVSIEPYLKDLRLRLANQYAINFTAPARSKPSIESFQLKISAPSAKVDSPKLALIHPTTQAQR